MMISIRSYKIANKIYALCKHQVKPFIRKFGMNEKNKVLKEISKLQKKGLNPPNLPFLFSLVVFLHTKDYPLQKKFEKKWSYSLQRN